MTVVATRHWSLPDTHNIRDLGGYARLGGGSTQWGRLLRGEALHPLQPASVDRLVEAGLGTVIDLRGPHETGVNPHPFRDHPRVSYRNIPLYDAMDPIAVSAVPFEMGQRYRDALDRCGPRIAQVLRAIIAAPPGMVLFHCTAGKDRTGIMAALILLLAGVERSEVVADYALTATAGDLIRQLRERAIAAGGKPEHVDRVLVADPPTMQRMLEHLDEAHGGIDVYIASIGITPGEAARLIERLCG